MSLQTKFAGILFEYLGEDSDQDTVAEMVEKLVAAVGTPAAGRKVKLKKTSSTATRPYNAFMKAAATALSKKPEKQDAKEANAELPITVGEFHVRDTKSQTQAWYDSIKDEDLGITGDSIATLGELFAELVAMEPGIGHMQLAARAWAFIPDDDRDALVGQLQLL